MDDRASGWFDVVKTPRGWVYSLPRAHRVGMHWAELAVSSLFVVIMFAAGAGSLGYALASTPGAELGASRTDILFVAAVGFFLFFLGSAVGIQVLRCQFARDEIRLDPRAIRATWRAGPISWSKTVPRSSVAQLTVVRRSRSTAPDPAEGDDFHVLTAEDHAGIRRSLVAGYPRTLLLALAVDLTSRWKTLGVDPDLVDVGAKKLAVTEDTEVPTDIRERPRPPRGTRLVFERMGTSGARIRRPPRTFASAEAVVPIVLGIGALLAASPVAASAIRNGVDGGLWLEPIVPATLVMFGALMTLIGVRLACLESWLTVTPDFLTLVTADLTSTSSKTWTRLQIVAIRVDVKVVPSSGSGEGPLCINRLLLRATDAPRFSVVAGARERAFVQLLRKPAGTPDSAFLVVGSRTGPGEVIDTVPLAAGRYDYALRQETPACKLGATSKSLTIIAEPEEELTLGAGLTKPELEWIATTLRGVLGVPASPV